MMVSEGIQLWAILSSDYEYKFKPGKEIVHTGATSRLPLKVLEENKFSPPYQVSSNGLNERVQTLKKALRSNHESMMELILSRFLLQYRIPNQPLINHRLG